MDLLGLFQHWHSFICYFQSKLQKISILWFQYRESKLLCFFYSSLLVFAQKRSNATLAKLLVISFWVEFVGGVLIFIFGPHFWGLNYWLATAHPISRLPVFFMGVCAGILCNRIQNGDFDALESKLKEYIKHRWQSKIISFRNRQRIKQLWMVILFWQLLALAFLP